MSEASLPRCLGTSPSKRVPRPNMANVPSSVIDEIAAEANPTASGGNCRPESLQGQEKLSYVVPPSYFLMFIIGPRGDPQHILVNFLKLITQYVRWTLPGAGNNAFQVPKQACVSSGNECTLPFSCFERVNIT